MNRIGHIPFVALVLAGSLQGDVEAARRRAPRHAPPPRASTAPARPTVAPPTLDDVLRAFERLPGVSARFRETRRIAVLVDPIVTDGSLHYRAPSSFVRITDPPRASRLQLEGDRLQVSSSATQQTVDLSAQPVARQVLDGLTAVLRGDRAALERAYAVSFALRPVEGPEAWEITLIPSAESLRGIFRSIRVRGTGIRLSLLALEETSGDVSETTFTDVRAPRSFTPDELRTLFGTDAR